MKQYAANDFAVVAESHLCMYPSKADDYRTPEISTTTSRRIITGMQDDLSNTSEDKLIEILKTKLNKQILLSTTTNDKSEQVLEKLPIKSQVYYELSDISDEEEELLLYQFDEPKNQSPMLTTTTTTTTTATEKEVNEIIQNETEDRQTQAVWSKQERQKN